MFFPRKANSNLSSFFKQPSNSKYFNYASLMKFSTKRTPLRIGIMGAPGSGKGTVAPMISNEYSIKVISTGDLLRKEILDNSEIGKVAHQEIISGKLVDNSIMIELVGKAIKEFNEIGWLLDGYPRSFEQAKDIERILEPHNIKLRKMFFIDVPDDEIIRRISGRLVHLNSGRTYHRDFSPPKVDNIDDITGEPLVQREDDKLETIKLRLNTFREQTLPVIKYYSEINLLEVIRAPNSKEAFQVIHSMIEKL